MARRDAEDVFRDLRAAPADRQEAETPVPEDEPLVPAEETPPEPPLVARRGVAGRRPAGDDPAEEESDDLQGRPGELLRTLRQGTQGAGASEP